MSSPPQTVPFAVKALFDYKSDYEDDLSFSTGQIISVTTIEDDEWYLGTIDGRSGMFPKNFVEILEPKVPSRPARSAKETDSSKIDPGSSAPGIQHGLIPGDVILGDVDPNSKPDRSPDVGLDVNFDLSRPHANAIDLVDHQLNTSTDAAPATDPSVLAASPKQARAPQSQGVFPGQKIMDPYGNKKQFVGAKSSYVPKITPRDESNLVSHAHAAKHSNDPDTVKLSEPMHEQEPEEPKVSLKERIALLQKHQQEEQEREAAALAKQEEREAAALAKKQQKERKSSIDSHAPIVISDRDEDFAEPKQSLDSVEVADPVIHASPIDDDADSQAETEVIEGDDQPIDQLDDEDLKRRKLVERMAKMSGGRNMFGMMGMSTPFGQPASVSKAKRASVSGDKETSKNDIQEDSPGLEHVPSRKASIKSTKSSKSTIEHDHHAVGAPSRKSSTTSRDHAVDSTAPDLAPTAPSVPDTTEFSSNPRRKSEIATHAPAIPSNVHDSGKDSLPLVPHGPEISIPQIPTHVPAELLPHTLDFSDSSSDEDQMPSTMPKSAAVLDRPPPPVPQPVPGTTFDAPRGPPPVPQGLRAPRPEETLLDEGNLTLGNSISSSSPIRVSGPVLDALAREAPAPPLPSLSPTPSRNYPKVPPPPPSVPSFPPDSPPFLEQSTRVNTNASPIKPPVPSMPPPPISPSDVYHRSLPEPSVTSLSAAPPIPSLPTAPPPSGPPPLPRALSEYGSSSEEDDDDTDDEIRPDQSKVSPTGPSPVERSKTTDFSHKHHSHPHRTSIGRASTESHAYAALSRESTRSGPRASGEVSSVARSKSLSNKHGGPTLADIALSSIQPDLTHDLAHSDWWLRQELPPTLAPQNGLDLTFEIDSNTLTKRCNRSICYRDYYILFADLSQLVLELYYDVSDPRSSIKLAEYFTKSFPTPSREILHQCHKQFGPHIAEKATALVGTRAIGGVTVNALESVGKNKVLKRIGDQSFGIVVYENSNRQVTRSIDDLRPGDILWISNAKFAGHNLMSTKSVVVGANEPHTAIIVETDPKKEKWKVVELDASGKTKATSYKATDLKRGTIKVFRPVDRSYVGW